MIMSAEKGRVKIVYSASDAPTPSSPVQTPISFLRAFAHGLHTGCAKLVDAAQPGRERS
jgi:hypothetical protein